MRMMVFSLLLTFLACSGVTQVPHPDSSKSVQLTPAEEHEWHEVLKQSPKFRHLLRQAPDSEEFFREEIALRRFLNRKYPDLCSSEERAEILRNAQDKAIARTYRQQILAPKIHISRDDARKIYREHREGWTHPRSVAASEIFLWAPTDLPELRAQKAALITRLHAQCTTIDTFHEAARTYSEATSAYRGGTTGTIEENQVSGPIHDALFTGKLGVSKLVETPQGFYLFFITRIHPAHGKSFEQVEDKILARLKVMELRRLLQQRLSELQAMFEVHEDAGDGGAVLTIGKKPYSAQDLDILKPNLHLVKSRAIAILEEGEMREKGIKPEPPAAVSVDFMISQRIFDRLLEEKLQESSPEDESTNSNEVSTGKAIERWSFDLLRIKNADQPKVLFRLYRLLFDEHNDLQAVASRIREDDTLVAKLLPFREELPENVAGLGPEIHTTLKNLKPGETSHPLHPRQSHDLVVCHMIDRHPDLKATARTRAHQAQSRRRRRLEKELRDELLESCGFRPTQRKDSSSRQERSNH